MNNTTNILIVGRCVNCGMIFADSGAVSAHMTMTDHVVTPAWPRPTWKLPRPDLVVIKELADEIEQAVADETDRPAREAAEDAERNRYVDLAREQLYLAAGAAFAGGFIVGILILLAL